MSMKSSANDARGAAGEDDGVAVGVDVGSAMSGEDGGRTAAGACPRAGSGPRSARSTAFARAAVGGTTIASGPLRQSRGVDPRRAARSAPAPRVHVDVALLAAIIVGALVVIGGAVWILVWSQASPRRTEAVESGPPPVYLPHGDLGTAAMRPAPSAAALPAVAPPPAAARSTAEAVPPLALAVRAERALGWAGDGGSPSLRARR